jgi:aspartyl-tRNA(Asn)/glutamyl-tRNA(Gln) amidotransferase subunit B
MASPLWPAGWQPVMGLEIHAQLATTTKIYCADEVTFGAPPNTHVSPISLGHPGALPTLNAAGIEQAITLGLATGCSIAERSHFARKNYFYPDLPKGYQISQDTTPICYDGSLSIRLKDGSAKTIRIQRIHLEEDAGKSLHDQDLYDSLIDLNRASAGLIEIVSHPDLRSPEEAMAYLTEVRKLVRYLDVCDGNMEEGSLRCDANVSVMRVGSTEFGTRCEIKNMNSISNVGRAIVYEINRQIEILEGGGTITQGTRTWDASTGRTLALRDKESADDYRYFPEPDLQPLRVSAAKREAIRARMPELPQVIFERLTTEHKLSEFDAGLITEERANSAYFFKTAQDYEQAYQQPIELRALATWMNGPIRTTLNETAGDITRYPVTTVTTAQLIHLFASGTVSQSAVKEEVYPLVLAAAIEGRALDPLALAQEKNLLQQSDAGELRSIIAEVLAKNPEQVATYRGGKAGLLGFFVGQVRHATGGKADPKIVNQLLLEALGQS